MRAPVREVRGNVLFGYGGERSAYFRVPTISYELLRDKVKRGELDAWAWFAQTVEADFTIYRVGRAYPAEEYTQRAAAIADPRRVYADRWRAYLDAQQPRVAALSSVDPEVYIRVELRPERRRRRAAPELVGEAEAAAFDVLREQFPDARRAHPAELVWLARRAPLRALCEPPMDQHYNPQPLDCDGQLWQVSWSQFNRFFGYEIAREPHGLNITTEHGTSWQAVLAISSTPEEWDFPSGELMFAPLERYGAPVDAVTHVRWVANEDMRKGARGRVLDADNAHRDQSHQSLSWVPEENRNLARDTEHYYATEPNPAGLQTSRFLVVAATTAEDREEAVRKLRAAYTGVRLERLPFAKQADGFLDTVPGVRGARVTDYAEFLRLETFGSMMPHATHGAGPARGVFFGDTHRRVVRRDPREAARRRRSPAALYSGALGSGKTLAAEKIAAEDALAGSQVVASDPKPGGGDWKLDRLPELDGMVHVIELAATAPNRGLLDPLVISPSAWREDRGTSFLTDLAAGAPFHWKVRIRERVQEILDTPNPGCLRVIEALAAGDHEDKQIARHLSTYAKSGLASLGISDGDPSRVRVDHPLTIIRPAGLALPGVDVVRDAYDHIEVVSVAILKLIAIFAMRAVDSDRSRHKRICLDEAHVFIGTPDGRRVIQDLNTMGRALNASMDLITQRMSVEVLELVELMAQRYVFGQESEPQARIGAMVLGLDPDDERVIRRILGLRAGRCLYRDLDGRIADTQVDLLPEWLHVLDTDPPEVTEQVAA